MRTEGNHHVDFRLYQRSSDEHFFAWKLIQNQELKVAIRNDGTAKGWNFLKKYKNNNGKSQLEEPFEFWAYELFGWQQACRTAITVIGTEKMVIDCDDNHNDDYDDINRKMWAQRSRSISIAHETDHNSSATRASIFTPTKWFKIHRSIQFINISNEICLSFPPLYIVQWKNTY